VLSTSVYALLKRCYKNPTTFWWQCWWWWWWWWCGRKVLRPSHQSRFLHSAVLLGRLMLVFGGNTHNDTSAGRSTKCYSISFMVYDIGASDAGRW